MKPIILVNNNIKLHKTVTLNSSNAYTIEMNNFDSTKHYASKKMYNNSQKHTDLHIAVSLMLFS